MIYSTLNSNYSFVDKLKSFTVLDPQDGQFFGKLNFFESLPLNFKSTEIT